jgi:thiol:disulfide interchange protein
MLLWGRYWRSDTHIKPALSFVYVLGLALASLWFGLVVTFHWRAFQWPLILLTVASVVGAAVVGRSARRKDRSAE